MANGVGRTDNTPLPLLEQAIGMCSLGCLTWVSDLGQGKSVQDLLVENLRQGGPLLSLPYH